MKICYFAEEVERLKKRPADDGMEEVLAAILEELLRQMPPATEHSQSCAGTEKPILEETQGFSLATPEAGVTLH